jgi:hypothetical protein
MKVIIVLSLELDTPEQIVAAMTAIDPPHVPFFTGTARVAIMDDAAYVEGWLDEG